MLVAIVMQPLKRGALAALCVPLLASGCATSGTNSADRVNETVLDNASSYIIHAQARGHPLRLKVDPGAPFFILLNDKVAKELRLVSTKSAKLAVGPMRLNGNTRNEKLTIGSVTASKPIMWIKGQAIADADGVINPAHVPGDRVTLQIGKPSPGERVIELQMRFDRQRGLYHEFDYGGQLILTRFTLAEPLTTTTGATASVIAKRRRGLWEGGLFTYPVRFGVPRPVRNMVLSDTLSVKGFPVRKFAVRILDDRGSYRLPDKEAVVDIAEEDVKEQEEHVIVTAQSKRRYGAPHFWMMIGRNDLSRCSSISYETKAKRMILSCSVPAV